MAIIKAYISPDNRSIGIQGVVNYQLTPDELALKSGITQAKGFLGRIPRQRLGNGIDRDYEVQEYDSPDDKDLLNSGTVSRFGHRIFSDVIFAVDDVELPVLNALVEVTRDNTIVKTAVQGRNGTVKEYIAAEDYQIRVQGSIIGNEKDKYPYEQVKAFTELCNHQGTIEVISQYLSIFNIWEMVLKSQSFKHREGFQNIEDFALNFLSHTPMPLIVQEENASQDTVMRL